MVWKCERCTYESNADDLGICELCTGKRYRLQEDPEQIRGFDSCRSPPNKRLRTSLVWHVAQAQMPMMQQSRKFAVGNDQVGESERHVTTTTTNTTSPALVAAIA